jgi:hypothetical protein
MRKENKNTYNIPPLCNIESIALPSISAIWTIAIGNIKIELAKIGGITPERLIFNGKKK